MKVFVTGATGYVGSGIARALQRAGHAPVGLARSVERADAARAPGVEWVIGNVREPEGFRAAATACEALIHAAAEYGPEVEPLDRLAIDTLVSAARAGGSRRVMIYTSGLWLLGVNKQSVVDETAPIDHPPEAASWRGQHEAAVLGAAGGTLTTAVVRPGNIYGGGDGFFGSMFAQSVREGAPTVVGDGKNRWSNVHLDDVADLYLRVIEGAWSGEFQSLPAAERLFHAMDGSADRVGEIARAASLAAGKSGSVRLWPVEEARVKLGASAEAMAMDQHVAAPRSERVLGWHPRWRGFVRNAPELFEEWKRWS